MKKRIALLIISFFCFIGITIAISWAWFLNNELVTPDISGYSATAYFAGGDGSKEHPYEIATPKHLYNLAWLQYLGVFNKEGEGNVPDESTGKFTQYNFVLNQDIDMTGWVLPPIGTTKYPFIGAFNGQGFTVSNLKTSNVFSEYGQRHPSSESAVSNVNIIGFFGVIGEINRNETIKIDGNFNYSSEANYFINTYLENTTVKSGNSDTLIGLGVGYINGTVQDVGIIDSRLDLVSANPISPYTSNISNYGVAGYATEDYVTQKVKSSTLVYNPTYDYTDFNFSGMGSQNDWGGSLNFANTYKRIYDIVKSTSDNTNKITSNNANFVVSEIQYYKVENGLSVIDEDKIKISNYSNTFVNFATTATTGVKYVNYNNANGSYLRTAISGDTDQYMTLTALYKNVIIVTKTEETENGYKISDPNDGYYLDLTGTRTNNTLDYNCSINNTSSNERVWVLSGDNSGYLYTYFEDDGKKYYLNATTTALTLSSSENNRTTWNYDSENQGFYFTSGGFNYYLKRYNGQWCTTPLYIISDNNENYIKMNGTNNNTRVVNTRYAAEATVWDFTTFGTNPSGSIRTISGAITRYLNINNGSLVTNSTALQWQNNNGLYNGSNYIQFKNGYWVAEANPSYKIEYNTHYLSTLLNDTTEDNAALWTFSGDLATNNDGGEGTISMILDGTVNYLGPINGSLGISTTSSDWMNYGNVLYTFDDSQLYVLQYDDGWKLLMVDYYIVDHNGNYLTFNNATSIRNATTPTTLWHFSNVSGYPRGTITCTNNNNTYYLDHDGTNVVLSSTNNTTWYNDGDGLYCLIGDVKNYLVYDNGWKLISYTYKISYGTNYLSIDSNGDIITTNEASATNWIFSNSGSYPSGTIYADGYYLYLDNNGVFATTNNAGNATSFNNDGSKLYNGNNSIQYYNNHWILAKAFNISFNNTYLGFNGNIGTSVNTVWFYYNNQEYPSGNIYTIYNNNIYYLYNNGGTLNGNQTNKTNWSNTGSGIYTGQNYIQLVNGNWICDTLKYHYISNGTHYLRVNNNNLTDGNANNATLWTFSNPGQNPGGTIQYNGRYLSATKSGMIWPTYTLSYNTTTTTWTNNQGKLIGNNCGLRNSGTTWDANSTGNATTLTFTQPLAQTSDVYTYEEVYTQTTGSNNRSDYDNEIYNSISLSAVTKRSSTSQVYSNYELNSATATVYTNSGNDFTGDNALPSVYSAIPITTKGDKLQTVPSDYSTGNNYVVDESNTGYIISGGHEPRKAADLRISNFNQTGNEFTGLPSDLIAGSYTNGTLGNVYTVAQDGNTYNAKLITESTNNGVKTNDCGFTKYFESKTTMQKTLSDSKNNSKLYGAHFMNAPISKNKYIIMPEVLINGETMPNFQMPEDCIDFTLKSKGIINFFSSYFYSNSDDGGANNCFFSLNEIIRDANGNIAQIRHILNVYEKKSDGTYVYYYQDPDNTSETGYYTKDRDGNIVTVSSFNSSEYNLKYDANWIEDPAKSTANTTNRQNFYGSNGSNYGNKIFYFEIPANVGEYALGSVNKKDKSNKVYNGAYILYLDIGANAQKVERTIITQKSENILDTFEYITGIAIISSKEDVVADPTLLKAENSAVVIISQGTTGEVTFTRDDSVITVSKNVSSSYISEDVTLEYDNNSITVSPINHDTKTTKYLEYVDYNTSNLDVWVTHIKQVDDGEKTYSFECLVENPDNEEWTLFDNEGNEVTIDSITINVADCTIVIDSYNYMYDVESTVTESITINLALDGTKTTTIVNDYAVTGNSVVITTTETFTVNIVTKDNSYVLKINGYEKDANSTQEVAAS